MTLNKKKIVVGISHGDINGIAYELILKTFQDRRIYELCTPVLYGSSKVLAYYQKLLNIPKITFYNLQNPSKAKTNTLNIINCIDASVNVEVSHATKNAGTAAFQALEHAVIDSKKNEIDLLVTCPINKHTIQSERFQFTGHTGYLSNTFKQKNTLMMLVSCSLKVGLVTEHIPISKVSSSITVENLLSKIHILHQSMIKDFVKVKGRIAILSLNPHAGDNGLIGSEENKILTTVIKKAREEKILAYGPYPADGFWGNYLFKNFDAVLAMYHDQGLIPFKMLAFEKGVNFTAGLPIVRTSPVHGTAYDIAGQNKASCQSFKNAIYAAIDIYRNRSMYEKNKTNSIDKIGHKP